jgi:hypothetical protein
MEVLPPTAARIKKARLLLIGALVTAGLLLIISIALAFLFTQQASLLDDETARANALQAQLTQEATLSADLRSRLTATQSQLKALAEEQARLAEKSRAQAEKAARVPGTPGTPQADKVRQPPLAVRVAFDRSIFGRRTYAVITNTGTTDIALAIQLSRPSTGEQRSFALKLAVGARDEIDPREGMQFAPGDVLTVSSTGFDPMKLNVP